MCRIPVSDEISWCSMMLWSLHTENTRLISRWIIFDALRPIWSRHFNVTDTFRQFYGISGITDLESRLEVTEVVDFGTNRKSAYDFLLVLNSNLGPILLRFRDIRFFDTPPLFRPNFRVVPLKKVQDVGVCGERRPPR